MSSSVVLVATDHCLTNPVVKIVLVSSKSVVQIANPLDHCQWNCLMVVCYGLVVCLVLALDVTIRRHHLEKHCQNLWGLHCAALSIGVRVVGEVNCLLAAQKHKYISSYHKKKKNTTKLTTLFRFGEY
jgi:hypothetical protein